MLRELTKKDWLSLLGIPEDRIPQALILRGTRNLKRHYAAYRERFTNALDVGAPNGILEDIFIGNLNEDPVAYASVYGAPMASEVVHLFGVLGTRLVIQTGCCGGIADGLLAGDLFIATSAHSGEGASQYYKTTGKTTAASIGFNDNEAARKTESRGISLHRGTIFTTSALFAEGAAEIEKWHASGFAAVDMETSATFAVAEHFGMDRGSILFVFDNPRQGDHALLEDEEKDRRRSIGNQLMMDVALAAVQRGEGG
ncbi:MAG: phosphorylase family protein [Planctomycetota bacterium]|jgi:purine-nucleoside phosphorylase